MDEGGAAEVVEAILGEDLGTSLEPNGLAELDSIGSHELRGEHAEGTEESPASMDDLNLAVLGEGGRVSREANSVPAVVTRELSGEVRGGGSGEGACEEISDKISL